MRAALAWISLAFLSGCTPPAPEVPTAVVVAPEPAPTASAAPSAEPAGGKPVVVPQRLRADARVLELSPRGDLLLVQDAGALHVVDVATGQTRGLLAGCVDSAVWSGDQRAVVTACQRTRQGRIWDMATDTTREIKFSVPSPELGVPPTGALVFAPGPGAIDLIDVARGTVHRRETGHPGEVWRVHAAQSGWMVATDPEQVTAFGPTGKVVRAIPKARDATAFSLGSSGKRLALADSTGITTYDLERGDRLARITPCGDGVVDDVEWSEDERRLLVTCGPGTSSPARALVLTEGGAEERELIQGPRSRFFVRPRGDRVAVTHPALGVAVFDIETGRELFRVAPPHHTVRYLELSRNLERFLYHESRSVTSFAVLDPSGKAVNAPLRVEGGDLSLGHVRGLLKLQTDRGSLTYLDPINEQILRDVPGALNPDGTVFLSLAHALELVDRRTGARHRVPSEHAVGDAPEFSTGGGWLGVVEEVTKGKRTEQVLRVYDARTGKEGRTFSFGRVARTIAWSPDDALIALHEKAGGPRCEDDDAPGCWKIRVHDVRSGRALTTIAVSGTLDRVGFMPDSKHIIVNDRVRDARSGRVAWTLPPGADVETAILGSALLALSAQGKWLFVESATGKVVHEAADLGRVIALSWDARFLLANHGGAAWLWDTSTWTKRETKLQVDADQHVFVSDDGRFVYLAEGPDLVVYRVEDGRSLRRRVPAFDFDVTDEGVFDPEQAQSGALLVRRGADVARSPMGTLSVVEAELGHPGLRADFMAGKPVGPR